MPVKDWTGPPPFGGRATVIFGARRPTKPTHLQMPDAPDGMPEYISLIERWDSDEVTLEQLPEPPA